MNQLTLTFEHTHARRTDPITSHMAAARAVRFAGGHAATILTCLQDFGPATADEIAKRTHLNSVQICRRLPELEKVGDAMPTGRMRLSPSGCSEREWKAA